MPFIKPEKREPLLKGEILPTDKGDLTFLRYVPLKLAWDKERRWTTAHNLAKDLFDMDDSQTAKFLAYLEFYIRHVHKYETEKIAENGDI